jgi:hypothetical protein
VENGIERGNEQQSEPADKRTVVKTEALHGRERICQCNCLAKIHQTGKEAEDSESMDNYRNICSNKRLARVSVRKDAIDSDEHG